MVLGGESMKNVGNLDRIIRLILGVVLLSMFFILEGGLRWISVFGITLIATAIIRTCPLYLPFGLSTFRKK